MLTIILFFLFIDILKQIIVLFIVVRYIQKFLSIVSASIILLLAYGPKISYAATLQWQKSNGVDYFSQDVRVSQINSFTVFASQRNGSFSGLFKSSDGGINFLNILPMELGRDVNAIALSRVSINKIWVSTYEQGVFSTSDSGINWTQYSFGTTKLRYITIDPTDDNILFVGTGDNNLNGGIYKTTNGGISWIKVGESTYGSKNCLSIYIDPTNHNRIFAGSDTNLYVSLDGGNNWSALSLSNAPYPAIVVDSSIPTTIYSGSSSIGIFKSQDNGATWALKNINMGISLVFRLVKDIDETLYATKIGNGGGVWKSTDGAETWENIADPAWGSANTWGLDAKGGRIYVGVEGLGIYVANADGSDPFATPTPTPSPSPSPTPIPSPTPTPDPSPIPSSGPNPVVLVPGFGGSWANPIVGGDQNSTYEDWNLIPIFGNRYYGPLLGALRNAGLTENQTYFVFAYDYRKSVQTTADWLNDYLENEVLPKNPGKKVNIASHSMGGLVTRYCMEKIVGCSEKINRVVTAGTPHQGLTDAYRFWSGLDADNSNILMNVAEQFILRLIKKTQSDPVTQMQSNFPGVRDLLPVVQYIQNKPYSAMNPINKNLTLEQVSIVSLNFTSSLRTLSGIKFDTDRMFAVSNPNKKDQAKGLWVDGKPTRTYFRDGDGTVLLSSSQIPGSNAKTYPKLAHSDYFRDQKGIKDTLDWFDLTAVIPNLPFVSSPVLIIITSPNAAPLGLMATNQTIQSDTPQVEFIENPSKDYIKHLKGNKSGNFTIETFLFKPNNVKKHEYSGYIRRDEEKELELETD